MKLTTESDYVPAVRGGLLHDHAVRHLQVLQGLGYKRPTLHPDCLLLNDLASWMDRRDLKPAELTESEVARFLADHMRMRRSRLRPKQKTLRRFLAMLREEGVLAAPPPPTRHMRVEPWVDAFARHLREDRGCPESTVANYSLPVRRLLREAPMPRQLNSEAITRFFQGYVRRHGRAATATAACGIKAFVRFLCLQSVVTSDLSAAVPKVAGWAQARLPRCLPARELEKVLNALGNATPKQRRDHAIILLLARLGLRSCEVAALRLEDVDWPAGRLLIRSVKAGRAIYLPLPADAARAIACYVQTARPACQCREIFLRVMAPVKGLSRIAVGGVARAAFLRVGLSGPSLGAHTFRHTLASELLRQGASLPQIGRILRHRDTSTTALYAKVDLKTLRPLAMRWPGGEK